jgi:hypothetical protein
MFTTVPKTFKLAGLTVTVKLDPTFIKLHKKVGEVIYAKQTITLDPTVGEEQLKVNFLHELLHYIFYVQNEHELRNNEKVVDLTAHFLCQVMETMTYE